jgi:hypothetical protein
MRNNTYFTKAELAMFGRQKPLFNDAQFKFINRKTPESEIEIKTDKSEFKYKSVKAAYVKALVTMVTGGNYDFEILSEEFIVSTKETKVKARLTIRSNGQTSFREQIGQHYLNSRTETSGSHTTSYASDIGNGYKAAASDAFKKCASEFGFFWDIYGQEHAENKKKEQPELDHAETKKIERLKFFLVTCTIPEEVENVYNKFLETADESEASKKLLKDQMNRVITDKE